MVYAAVLKAVLNWVSVRIRMGVQNWSVRLAGPGREIFILKITGSNPVPTTIIKYLAELAYCTAPYELGKVVFTWVIIIGSNPIIFNKRSLTYWYNKHKLKMLWLAHVKRKEWVRGFESLTFRWERWQSGWMQTYRHLFGEDPAGWGTNLENWQVANNGFRVRVSVSPRCILLVKNRVTSKVWKPVEVSSLSVRVRPMVINVYRGGEIGKHAGIYLFFIRWFRNFTLFDKVLELLYVMLNYVQINMGKFFFFWKYFMKIMGSCQNGYVWLCKS